MSEAVVVFGKSPEPGRVKTRLSSEVGEEMAARLYEAFAQDTFEIALNYQRERLEDGESVRLILAWEGSADCELAKRALDRGFEFVEQGAGDLGARLKRVVRGLRQEVVEQILILGTDAPTMTAEQLHLARLGLQISDLIFGPSFDGGYFLVGLGSGREGKVAPEEVIFDEITWSTARVLSQSLERAERAGLLSDLLGFWYDVDTFEDLKFLNFHLFQYLKVHNPAVGRFTRQLLASSTDLGL